MPNRNWLILMLVSLLFIELFLYQHGVDTLVPKLINWWMGS